MTDRERAELEQAGTALAAADAARGRALEQITALMKASDGSLSVAEMARLAGVSRVTAYRMLGRDAGR